jgi:hypothetical protein
MFTTFKSIIILNSIASRSISCWMSFMLNEIMSEYSIKSNELRIDSRFCHLQNRKTTVNALQNRQSRQLIIRSSQSWELMSRLIDKCEIEQSSSICTFITIIATQSIQIIRYNNFCISIRFHWIRSVHIQLIYSFSSFTQFIRSVKTHSVSSLSQSTLI